MLIVATLIAVAPSFAQNQPASPAVASSPVAAPSGQPDSAEMMKQMMELAKLNENHQLLADLAGTWNYTVKFWPAHGAGIQRHRRQEIDDGRTLPYGMDVTGKMQMHGPDGKMKDMTFKGMRIEDYDNVKKKFVGTWVDNTGTGIVMSGGDYGVATKTSTYTGEVEAIPGMKQKNRKVVKIIHKDHHTFEW